MDRVLPELELELELDGDGWVHRYVDKGQLRTVGVAENRATRVTLSWK
jgi:hypothetical protein